MGGAYWSGLNYMPLQTWDTPGHPRWVGRGSPQGKGPCADAQTPGPLHLLLCEQGTLHACTGTGACWGFYRLNSPFPPSLSFNHLLFGADQVVSGVQRRTGGASMLKEDPSKPDRTPKEVLFVWGSP